MPVTTNDVDAIVRAVHALDFAAPRPPVVGISGFGGAGKSTLATLLQERMPGSAVVSGDEFLLARPPVRRSDHWVDVDRDRLREQVLTPARHGQSIRHQVWDSASAAPGPWVMLDGATALIVEGLGLYAPGLVELFDVRVWIDLDLETATARGMWRDEHDYGNPQLDLWVQVWKPNDADFFDRFRPDQAADILFQPSRHHFASKELPSFCD